MKPTRNLFVRLLSLSAITLLASHSAQATSATWSGATNVWGTSSNWVGSPAVVPGTGDTATFDNAGGANDTISTGTITLSQILFATNAAAYTLGTAVGTGQITLNDSGSITINSAVVTNQVINANVVLGTTSGTAGYAFTNNSGTAGQLLTIAGNIRSGQSNTSNSIKTLTLGGSANGLISGIISGDGSQSGNAQTKTATVALLKTGTGTWTLSNANTYSGTTTIRAGTLAVGAAAPSGNNGALGNATSAVILGDASTLANDAPSLLINGVFTVGRAVTVGSVANANAYNATIGGSNVTLTSTYSGTITLSTAATNYTTTLQAATGGTVDFTNLWATNNRAITIGSSGNLGTVKLSNVLATTGGISVNFGTFLLGASDRLGDTTPVTVAGGTFDTGTALTDIVSLFNMSSGFLNGTGTITGATYGLSGGTVNANLGTGTLNVTGTVALNGTSDASAVNVSSGSLTLGSANRLANAAAVAVSGGSLAIGNFSDSVGTVLLTGGSITGTGGTLTGSSYAVQSGSISAILGGAGGLTKTTGGTVSLSAANTYTGPTTIQAGTLELLTGGSLASASIVVGDTGSIGAVLDAITTGLVIASGQTLSGIGTINGNTTIQFGGAIAPGNSPGILTNNGDMNLASGSTFQAEINGLTVGTGYDQLNVTGLSSTVSLAGLLSVTTGFSPTPGDLFFLIDNDGSSAISGVFSNAPIDGNTYTFGSQQYEISYFGDYDTVNSVYSFTGGNDVVLRAVPEPGAALLGGIGLLCLLRRRRNG